MANPATPLDNRAAIAQMGQELRDSMSFLLTEFVRPTMLQTQANAQALAETRAICDSNARSIAAQRESVDILRSVVDDTAAETAPHESRISDNEQRFQNMLAEAREDRKRLDRALDELAAQREAMRSLLSALATTNGRADRVEGRLDNLEQAS